MKILTGALRGQPLLFSPNPRLRPTSDKARKAIFDMFQGEIEGKRALDLFSGTGALGFEALSSGAEMVTFVEIERAQASAIKNNLEKLKLSQKGTVITMDALKAIEKLSQEEQRFDLVFIDPPYEKGLGQSALTALAGSKLLERGAFVVLECRDLETPPEAEDHFIRIKDKMYGDTQIAVYQKI